MNTNQSGSVIYSFFEIALIKASRLTRLQKCISIGSAIFLSFSYLKYKKISTPPKRLQHIPSVNYVRIMRAFLEGTPLMEINKSVIDPVINSKGLYLRPSRSIWHIYVTDPDIARTVYNKNDLFPKLDLTAANKGTFTGKFSVRSNNLFFSTGEEWKRQRRIANPAFHRAMPISLFGRYAMNLFESISLEKETLVDIGSYIERFTLDVIGDAGFDFEFNSLKEPDNPYAKRYENITNSQTSAFFYFFPSFDGEYLWMFPKRQRAHEDLDIFLSMVEEIIAKKRTKIADQKRINELNVAEGSFSESKSNIDKDILTLFIESANDDENKDLSIADNDMLLSNMCVLFTAGHDTTTASILFFLYELAVNQDIQQKAREEILSIFGEDNVDEAPNEKQLSKMNYLEMVIKENLRLHPPAPISSPRIATDDCVLGDTLVPKGSTIVIDTISLHRNSKYWTNPDVFNPDRFLSGGEAEENARHGPCFAAFGSGSRMCIGRKFTMNQQKAVLAMFLKKYTWTLPKDSIHKNGVITKGLFLLSVVDMKLVLSPR